MKWFESSDGIRYKRLPGSDYYLGTDGNLLKVVPMVTDSRGRYHIRKNGKRVVRSVTFLAKLYSKLK